MDTDKRNATESPIEVGFALKVALESAKANKPNDKSEKDRAYAILITDLEKAIAFHGVYIAGGSYA